ncbi:MAG: type I restriction-modification system subunit M [Proteobacteria bacterium]|nr:type I restriction-modification system subunit M [Pseudomonadota bacterium]
MSLSSTIKSIQDIMRKDDGVDGDAQRIGQLTWMLFLKVFDQKEEEWEDDAADKKKKYKSPIPEECRWRKWAKYLPSKDGKLAPQIQASELIDYVNNKVFPGLKELNIEGASENIEIAKAKVVREVFVDSNNYMKSGTLMLEVIEKLDEAIDFHDFKNRQNLGNMYEQILNDLRSAGNAGEFYTPRAVTQFMTQMVNPRLDKRETVLDPACGTGGFLTAVIDHFNSQINKKSGADDKKAVEVCIHGIEKKQLPHLLCTTNMMLHGIDVPSQIEHRNTLSKGWNDWSKNDQVDCVITNPPFGGMEEDGVGTDFPADVRTRETSDMFLTLIVKKLLKDGGRGAIVLPDGNLFGEGVKAKVKQLLLDECSLHTIIRLPNGVFNPYTGIKTNLLFFTKGKPTETIWYYEHPYPSGYKSYSKTKPLKLEEFQREKEWWGKESNGFADREESEFAWKIDFKSRKLVAEAKAKPFWDKAETLNNEASDLESNLKELRKSIKGTNGKTEREQVDEEIEILKNKAEKLRLKAKDEQASGDRIFWPIYNLDEKNPNTPESEIHDPDELLLKLKKVTE